ncbi:hypothetical protein ACHQM5_024017 [Ranunculus cassubicifolius]
MYLSEPQDHGKYGSGDVHTPPVRAPPVHTPSLRVRGYAEPWSTGLCHCCDDPANCFITACCPCITFGQISELVDHGAHTCAYTGTIYGILVPTGLASLYSCSYRSRLRAQFNLKEDPCADCLVHFCCEVCSLCQEYRELRNRGFDMGIGYQANMERSGITTAAPQVEMEMRR